MANIKSQKKRIITNEKARMRNRAVKSELKTATRRVKEAVEAGNGAEAYEAACQACRLMDKAVSKGVIKKNQAANRKSGIMKLANTVVTDADIKAYKKPEHKAPATNGSKKAAAKAERLAKMQAASAEKDKRRAEHQKKEAAALKKKEKEAKEAAEAEAAAQAEADAEAVADPESTDAEGGVEEPSAEAQEEAAEEAEAKDAEAAEETAEEVAEETE